MGKAWKVVSPAHLASAKNWPNGSCSHCSLGSIHVSPILLPESRVGCLSGAALLETKPGLKGSKCVLPGLLGRGLCFCVREDLESERVPFEWIVGEAATQNALFQVNSFLLRASPSHYCIGSFPQYKLPEHLVGVRIGFTVMSNKIPSWVTWSLCGLIVELQGGCTCTATWCDSSGQCWC